MRELEPWFAQLQRDTQAQGLGEEAIHQRIARFLAEHQRREANSRGTIEQRLDQLRHEFQGAMTEHEISCQRTAQEFHGRGTQHEQLHQLVHNIVMNRLEECQVRFARLTEWMSGVTQNRSLIT